MFQTLWFFLKFLIIIVFLAWIISLSGTVVIDLLDYNITVPTNIFILALLVTIFILGFIYKLLQSVFLLPQIFSKHREETRHQKGYSALTRGLVAIAAGDSKQATYYARRAGNMLPKSKGKQQPLHLLLEAQAAQLRGENAVAQNRFEALMQDKDAAFLGIRGLLKSALDQGNTHLALQYANDAAQLHPNQIWIIQTQYHLQIENKMWDEVLKTAKIAKKNKALEPEKIISDEIAITLMRFDQAIKEKDFGMAERHLKTAMKLDKYYVPTNFRAAHYYISLGKNKKAAALIKDSWAQSPHPDLAKIWFELAPDAHKYQVKRSKWFQTLADINPNHIESHILLARAAMEMSLWGEAKASLIQAEKVYPSAQIYRLLAVVEQNSDYNDDSMHSLMEKASDALPEKSWVCTRTGIIYEEWMPIAPPHESFNTIIWQCPNIARIYVSKNQTFMAGSNNLLIDPA